LHIEKYKTGAALAAREHRLRPRPQLLIPEVGAAVSRINCSAQRDGGSAMGEFLAGASWGVWFVLAAIIAAGLWAIVH
jgi:hypothetical protein